MKAQWPPTSTRQQMDATGELLRRLFSLCPERLLRVILFGSAARGDFGDDSDIDLLIVADRTDAALEHALRITAARASLDYDVIFNLHIYSRALWEQ
ncbi:MAG: nucleotidyltransferase domain-containing protein, partial [Chloroflexi bacterium]|nr:nucleotidyltransferase domain-containing protein [Chloroflexota bacterium]